VLAKRKILMARKDKSPRTAEDIDNMNFPITCPNPKCGEKFTKKGAWLQKNHVFGCPVCGEPVVFNEEKLLRLFSDHAKNVRDVMDRLRSKTDNR
jgi:hypothetical protein